jgi:hypothetical protein
MDGNGQQASQATFAVAIMIVQLMIQDSFEDVL